MGTPGADSILRWKALETASHPDLQQEEQADEHCHPIRTGDIVGAKKEFRQRQDEDGRDELPQIERGGKEGHHGRSRVLAAFDGGNGQQVGHTDAIAHADKG